MKYFLVLFVLGIVSRNALARVLDNPVLYDFERRLVRLETRQFSESENLEHRMLKLEAQLGTGQGEETLETSTLANTFYEVPNTEKSSEDITLLQRLEKMEKKWEKELEQQLSIFSWKYDILADRFSAIEKHVEEHKNPKFEEIMERLRQLPEKTESAEYFESTTPTLDQILEKLRQDSEKPESAEVDDPKSEEKESDDSEPEEDFKEEEFVFEKIGSKFYAIIDDVQLSWEGALSKCQDQKGHLASLQNEEEWIVLKKALMSDHSYWVDINDKSEENEFVSKTTGQLAPFLKWDDNEPNSTPGAEDCVELRADHDYKMNDVRCSEERYYICELNPQ